MYHIFLTVYIKDFKFILNLNVIVIYRPLNTWGYTDKSYAIKSRVKSLEQLSGKVQPSTKDVLTTNAMHNI